MLILKDVSNGSFISLLLASQPISSPRSPLCSDCSLILDVTLEGDDDVVCSVRTSSVGRSCFVEGEEDLLRRHHDRVGKGLPGMEIIAS